MDCSVEGLAEEEIRDEAEKILMLQSDIIGTFLSTRGRTEG